MALLFVGCGQPGADEGATQGSQLAGVILTVASKDFTEQHILGEIAVHALEDAGADVVNRVGLEGSGNVRHLLLEGEVDLYWEYTGTAWSNYLGRTQRFADLAEQFEHVAAADLAEHDIRWFSPAPYNNSYAIATTDETSQQTGVATLSDLAALVRQGPATVELCAAEEFLTRPDGLPGLQQHYDFVISPDRIHTVPLHDLAPAVARQQSCDFGEVFTTNSRLGQLDLTLLDDDQQYFERYHPAVTVRAETAQQHPALEEIFSTIAAHLTPETIVDLNHKVEVEGHSPSQVARDWLTSTR